MNIVKAKMRFIGAKIYHSSIWQKLALPEMEQIRRISIRNHVGKIYVGFSLLVLIATTIFWATLGAKVHQSNSDQLVNTFLMQSPSDLQSSMLPSAHSMLLKLPFFWVLKFFGTSTGAFIIATNIMVLITVLCFAYIIYRIEKRPFIYATLMLAFSSMLLMVPSIPAPGNILPENMAMLATRNIEYVVYIVALFLIVNSEKIKSRNFLTGIALMLILGASDKLFISVGLVASIISLLIFALKKNWDLVIFSARWCVAVLAGAFLSILSLAILNSIHAIHFVGSSSTGPYGFVKNAHDIMLGFFYSITGLLSNFGANPGHVTTVLGSFPKEYIKGLMSLGGLAYLVNTALFVISVVAIMSVVRNSMKHHYGFLLSKSIKLSLSLVLSTFSTLILFIASNHYYAADARYLTLSLFTGFVAIVTVNQDKIRRKDHLLLSGIVIFTGIVLALPNLLQNHHLNKTALSSIDSRNRAVTEVLKHHKVDILVGDYWRVAPIKLNSQGKQNIMPLQGCAEVRSTLTSTKWNLDLRDHKFAYLLSLDKGLTDYPTCNLEQVLTAYGRPNSSTLIAGEQDNPKEILLFYDNGAGKSAPKVILPVPSTILPISLNDVPYKNCPGGRTIMNIVAHEDDDLLFINPDTKKSLDAKDCVRTIYLTAGDAGNDEYYWLGREQGSEAAYSKMLGNDEVWINRIVKIDTKQYINIAHPRGDYRATLIFFHLPDGNMKGQGFNAELYASLAKLNSGVTNNISSVDGQSNYTEDQLVSAIEQVINAFSVSEIRTQADLTDHHYPDHSDHANAGIMAKKAALSYDQKQFENNVHTPIYYYLGYPTHSRAENVTGLELEQKISYFLEYSKTDKATCRNEIACLRDPAYGAYLPRQYRL